MNQNDMNEDVPKVPTRTHLKTNLNNRINAQNLQQTKILSITSDKGPLENAVDMAAKKALGTAKLGSIPSLNTHHNTDLDQFRNLSVNLIKKLKIFLFFFMKISSTGSGDVHKEIDTAPIMHPSQIITSSVSKPNKSPNIIPKLIEGEKLVSTSEFTNLTSTDIVFVLPDNRGVNGKLCLTNFRLYFRSDVS